jgi:ABC-type branched-subunit amino acid transport system substrate-binding protein
VGATSSPETQAAYTVASAAGSLLISPSSTSPALTTLDGLTCSDNEPGLLWRTVPPDELQGQVIAQDLAARGIFAWSGNFYAQPLSEALGLEPDGALRVGLLHYNTSGEVDRLLAALEELVGG